MATDHRGIPGVVKNGVVVPQSANRLPDGAHVEIVLRSTEMTPELIAELAAWERAGDEAWDMIDEWESEEQ